LSQFDKDYCRGKFRRYNVEQPDRFFKRVRRFLIQLCKKHEDDTVLLVAHSLVFRFFMCVLKNEPASCARYQGYLHNGEVAAFDVLKKGGFHWKRL
jgi:broad specificity phosphatase PhoE